MCRHPSSSLSLSFPSLQRNKTPPKPNPGTIVPVFQCPTVARSMPSFPSFSPNTKSPCPLARKIDTSSPASSTAPWSLAHICFVSSALPHWSSQLHSGRFTGGHLVMHCQLCCSPLPLPVRCVRGMTYTHSTQPDPGLTCMKYIVTHKITHELRPPRRSVRESRAGLT